MKISLFFSEAIQSAIQEMLTGIFIAVPRFISALVLVLIGLIVSKIFRKFIQKLMEKMKLDNLGDQINKISILAENSIRLKLSVIAAATVYYLTLFIFLMVAVGVLDMPVLAELMKNILLFIPNLLVAFIILIGGIFLADAVRNAVLTACKSLGIPSAGIIASFVFYFIFINIVIVALSQAGINAQFFAQNISIIIGGAILAFSIGYGLASKDIVAGFLASYYSQGKFNIGDNISISGYSGKIVEMDRSSITIESENKKIIIPVNKVINESVEIYK
ncbi:MAG: mechanosensitive ion channel [Saprospiraceae bacterium]|nr:mechanosensitive ion channel [Saprospiraceae bacterium]